jgi:uncharacterized membrane protein YjgN (DUF898 family)
MDLSTANPLVVVLVVLAIVALLIWIVGRGRRL